MFSVHRPKKQNLAQRLSLYSYPTVIVVEANTKNVSVAKYMPITRRQIRTLLSR